MRSLHLLLVLALLGAGCEGGEDGLSYEVVTSLPAGDATGTALSGNYSYHLVTTACLGQCPTFSFLGFSVYICKEGSSTSSTASVVQKDGLLEVHMGSGLYVRDFKGGINKDGRFDVGGHSMVYSDQVSVTARVGGTISGTGSLSGSAQARGVGSAEGQAIDCTASYTVSGQRN